MNTLLPRTALVVALLGVGAAPAVAGHLHGYHAHGGYGPGHGMSAKWLSPRHAYGYRGHHYGKTYGPKYRSKHGKAYRKGHWGKPMRGCYPRPHRGSWVMSDPYRYGHGMNKGGYAHGQDGGQPGSQGHGVSEGGYTPRQGGGQTGSYGYGAAPASAAAAPYAVPQPAATAAAAPRDDAPGNIVETAIAADSFNTLLAAVEAADLVATLSGDGPFTVFAPTDAAFNRLPAGTVQGLLGDSDALTQVLTYHVVGARLDAADLVEQGRYRTLNGATVDLGQLKITQADVAASNGIIHILDEVLLPPGG